MPPFNISCVLCNDAMNCANASSFNYSEHFWLHSVTYTASHADFKIPSAMIALQSLFLGKHHLKEVRIKSCWFSIWQCRQSWNSFAKKSFNGFRDNSFRYEFLYQLKRTAGLLFKQLACQTMLHVPKWLWPIIGHLFEYKYRINFTEWTIPIFK